jgi:hypothetical protein
VRGQKRLQQLCGIVSAMIAQSKNRKPLNGAMWGLLGGPIGVLICACQSKLAAHEVEKPTLERVTEIDLDERSR